MIVNGKIVRYKDGYLLVKPDTDILPVLQLQQPRTVELRLNDGRSISNEQRKKIFAVIRDLAIWTGNEPEYLREMLTWDFCSKTERDVFSLSTVDMSTAKEFLNYLIEFCFDLGCQTKTSLLNQTDDIDRYLYFCLEHRKCAICNAPAEVHHVDRVGMGRDRETIVHVGLLAVALCPIHHEKAHKGEKELFQHFHIYGIKLDKHLCDVLSLRSHEKLKKGNTHE